jgi:hypothetical protein
MPDIDPLAFGIRFALTHETIGREARKLIRSLTERQLEHLQIRPSSCASARAWPSTSSGAWSSV